MALCYDNDTKRYDYCSSHLSTYVAVGVIVPLGICLIIVLVYFYLRCRQRRLRRQDQVYMATIIPIYDNEGGHPIPYNYSYPPGHTPASEDAFDKPPSYEQTIQEISETNRNNFADNSPAILPISTATRNQP